MKYNKAVVATAIVLILLPLGYSVAWSAFSLGSSDAGPFLQKAGGEAGEKCVLETTYGLNARFHHMHFLKQLRDDSVRKGERGEIGLNGCWECHANPAQNTSREEFCDKCHLAVNLHLGCFQCHHDPDTGAGANH